MAEITLTRAIDSGQSLSEDIIKESLKKILRTKFDKVKYLKKIPNNFVCRVKTRLFNPIVSLRGDIQMQIQGTRAKIMITAATKTNVWFWVTLILMLCFTWGVGILLMFWMYHSQKKTSFEAFKQSFEQLDFELGRI